MMRKMLVFVAFLCAFVSGPSFAFDASELNELTITNRTGKIIKYLFISPDDSDNWGPDMLGKNVLGTGKDVTFYMHYPERTGDFDILAIADDDQRYEIRDFRLTDGAKARLTLDAKSRTNVASPQLVTVRLNNRTGYDMVYVFFSPGDSVMYGADILGSTNQLDDRGSHSFFVLKPSSEVKYDFLGVDEDGDEYKFQYTIRPNANSVSADIEMRHLVTK